MQLYCYKILIVHVAHSHKKINYTAISTLANKYIPKLHINLMVFVLTKFQVIKMVQKAGSRLAPAFITCVKKSSKAELILLLFY